MALILAIEPDRKQSGHLTAMVRGRLHAELVMGDSAEHALEALGDRVPDLILTSALLSPKDEAVLGDRLRALHSSSAGVQTLTIPVLASPGRQRDLSRGVLSSLRRDRSKTATVQGCDPAVFAEQCREYLERAETERATEAENLTSAPAARAEHVPHHVPHVEHAEPVTPPEPEPVVEPVALLASLEPVALVEPLQPFAPVEPLEPLEPVEPLEPLEAPTGIAGLASFVAAMAELDEADAVDLDLSTLLEEPGSTSSLAMDIDVDDADADEPAVYELGELTNALTRTLTLDGQEVEQETEEELETLSEIELYSPLLRFSAAWPTLWMPTPGPTIVMAAKGSGSDDPTDWMDIIEALRRDAEQVQFSKPAALMAGSLPTAASDGSHEDPLVPALPKGTRRAQTQNAPAQDEWGIFDPDQCGFNALLAKLDRTGDEAEDKGTPLARTNGGRPLL